MKTYLLTLVLAVLVVLTGVSLRRSAAKVGNSTGAYPPVAGIGGSPIPLPPMGAGIGGSPIPLPPMAAGIGGSPIPLPPMEHGR